MTRGIPNRGDVLFTTEAPLANVAQIRTNDLIAFAQRVLILQTNERVVNTFLMYLLMTEFVRQRIYARSTGSTVIGIKQSQFRQVEIAFPNNITEQMLIVKHLQSLDLLLNDEKDLISKYKEEKQGLMQDLLTGKVRVAV